jgi:hypothetical protein
MQPTKEENRSPNIKYYLEPGDSTANLRCSCCTKGLTSVCGYIRIGGLPYALYYALLHNHASDLFVRLSISVGDWASPDPLTKYALCIDATPYEKHWKLSVLDACCSPQHTVPQFGTWLNRNDAGQNPLLADFVEVAGFILENDPAVKKYYQLKTGA